MSIKNRWQFHRYVRRNEWHSTLFHCSFQSLKLFSIHAWSFFLSCKSNMISIFSKFAFHSRGFHMQKRGRDWKSLHDLARERFHRKKMWKMKKFFSVHQPGRIFTKKSIYIKVSISNISYADEHWWSNRKLRGNILLVWNQESSWKSISFACTKLQFAYFSIWLNLFYIFWVLIKHQS